MWTLVLLEGKKVDFKKCPRHHYRITWKSLKEQLLWAPDEEETGVVRCRVESMVEPFTEAPGAWDVCMTLNSHRLKMCKAHGVCDVLRNGQSSCYLFFYLEA